jgi:hypothetical protein
MRKFQAGLVVAAMAGAGLVVTGTPAMAVTAACTKAKSGQTGSATCRGSGGSWRLFLDCATGADYRSGWYVLTSTPRTLSGSCAPSPVGSVNVETRSTV